MNNQIKEHSFLNRYDSNMVKFYIDEHVEQGLHPVEIGFFTSIFEKAIIPDNRRYIVIAVDGEEYTYRRKFAEVGWNCIICNLKGIIIAFCDDQKVNEPTIDKDLILYSKKKQIEKAKVSLPAMFASIMFLVGTSIVENYRFIGTANAVFIMEAVSASILAGMLLFTRIKAFTDLYKEYSRLVFDVKPNRIECDKNLRKNKSTFIIVTIVIILALVFIIVTNVFLWKD